MHLPLPLHRYARLRCLALALALWAAALSCRADSVRHALWELHGKHNTVYLMGSIHVLRPSDYPLAPEMLQAYAKADALVMEIDLADVDPAALQGELLAGATLPSGTTLTAILGPKRHARAAALARDIGVDLAIFDSYAPWFAAEAISQLQLAQLGFEPQAGVEMYFLERARADGKRIRGLETAQDQLAVFQALPLEAQADYLVSSLEQARALPQQVGDMVAAWRSGDSAWFDAQLKEEFGSDSVLSTALLAARNRKWVPQIEALLNADQNYLVIVGTGHLVGRNSVIELLQKDGVGATQR